MDDKTKSIVAHITIIGWIIALIQNQSDKGENTSFYLRQVLGLFLIGLVGYVVGIFTVQLVSTIISIGVLVLWILSLLGAINGEKKLTPGLGDMFQSWFKGIS